MGDPAQACIHHSPTQAITLRFEGGPNRFHGFARSNAWDVLHNDEARLAPRDDLGISNREDCAPTILGSLAGLREILTRRPADDDIRSEAGNFLGYGNVGEIPFENRMLEVSAIDINGSVPIVVGSHNIDASLFEAEGHSAAAGEKVNCRYVPLVFHALGLHFDRYRQINNYVSSNMLQDQSATEQIQL